MNKEQKKALLEALKEVNDRLDNAHKSGKLNQNSLQKVPKKK